MKKILQIVIIIVAGALPSLLLIHYLNLSTVKFIGSEFLLGYLGVFLGFAFSIVTFIMSLIDKAKAKVEADNNYTEQERRDTNKRIESFLEEVFDDMKFLFFSFLAVSLIMILEVWDTPYFALSSELWYTKAKILNAIKFSIFGFSVYGIYDLLISTFSLNTKVEKMLRNNNQTMKKNPVQQIDDDDSFSLDMSFEEALEMLVTTPLPETHKEQESELEQQNDDCD